MWSDWSGCRHDEYELEMLSFDLPLSARRLADDPWVQRLIDRLAHVSRRLASGQVDRLVECPADEVAIHLVIHHADSEVFLWCLDREPDHQRLPAFAGDEMFQAFVELELPGTSILELLQAQESGEGFESPLSFDREMGSLSPEDWFRTGHRE